MPDTAASLNRDHALNGVVSFIDLADHYPVAVIENAQARARIALHGAHVLDYQPTGEAPVLWLSDSARYTPGKAIRGGIPICWPWFGPDPEGRGRPAHGFARNRFWALESVQHEERRGTTLRFSLPASEETRALWPQPFVLRQQVTVGASLEVALQMENIGDAEMRCSGALHSYFSVADIAETQIEGLQGRAYLDQLDHHARKTQDGPIHIDREVDRIYLDTANAVTIQDAGRQRRIRIDARGSRSTVVWNPWIDKAAGMDDFHDGGHRQMVCVETANTADNTVRLAPGASHQLACVIRSVKTAAR